MDVPSDGDDLVVYVLDSFTAERDKLQAMLDGQYSSGNYPDKATVEGGIKLCNTLLAQKKDGLALLNKLKSMEDDFLDLLEDMTDVMAFFKNQKVVFDSAAALYRAMDAEKEYLQMEKAAQQGLYEIYQILHASKPYKQISRLPDLIHVVQTAYQELLNLKKQEVFADMDAAMKEIRQTASATQQDVIEMATKAFSEKYDVANKAQSLTTLDAMKIQISNLRQKYLKALMVTEVGPMKDIVSTGRSGVCHAAKLESAEDVDKYVADVKAKLLQMLNGHDALHII
jgi:hypothetical protein